MSPFPPQVSVSGLKKMLGGRDIYVWGAAFVGQGVARGLTRHGLKPIAFLDQSPRFQGKKIFGLSVRHPDVILDAPEKLKRAFIVLASGYWEAQMRDILEQTGLQGERDFIGSDVLAGLL